MRNVTEVALKDKIIHASPSEEIANVFTHLVGLILFAAGTLALLVKAYHQSDTLGVFSAYVFGFSLINMYLASTLYHAIRNPTFKGILHLGDHVSIFILL